MTVNPSSHTVVSSPEFPELNNLTNEQLIKLAEETDSLDAFLSQHSQLKDINLLIDETIDNVERLASKFFLIYSCSFLISRVKKL